MLTSLNWNFSKISLLIGGSHTQNSRCFTFTNLLEIFGNILANLSQYHTDYQYYTKQKIVRAWNLTLACSTDRGSGIPVFVEQATQNPRSGVYIIFYNT